MPHHLCISNVVCKLCHKSCYGDAVDLGAGAADGAADVVGAAAAAAAAADERKSPHDALYALELCGMVDEVQVWAGPNQDCEY